MLSGSVVSQVLALQPGQAYSRSRFIPLAQADHETIKEERRKLVSYLTPVVERARQQRDQNYHIHTTVSFTQSYDVIVIGLIVIEEDEL